MFISMWAQDKNGLIGKNGLLPWRLPNDMRFFREHTMDRILVMGRKTYEGLPNQSALEGRKNIVLTNNLNYKAKDVLICHSVQEVLEQLKSYDSKDVYIIGGGQIYEQFLPYCDTAHITRVDYKYQADTYITDFDKLDGWRVTARSEEHTYFDICYEFVCYQKEK